MIALGGGIPANANHVIVESSIQRRNLRSCNFVFLMSGATSLSIHENFFRSDWALHPYGPIHAMLFFNHLACELLVMIPAAVTSSFS